MTAQIDSASLVPNDVPGWCEFHALYVAAVAGAREGARFVEVGSWLGQSAIVMARAILASGKRIHFACVDTWKGSAGDPEHFAPTVAAHGGSARGAFENNLRQHGVHDLVAIVEADSAAGAAAFAAASLDFVFIDADHTVESVKRDLAAWLPKMRRGGILAGHDWGYLGVTEGVLACLPADQIQLSGTCWIYEVP